MGSDTVWYSLGQGAFTDNAKALYGPILLH